MSFRLLTVVLCCLAVGAMLAGSLPGNDGPTQEKSAATVANDLKAYGPKAGVAPAEAGAFLEPSQQDEAATAAVVEDPDVQDAAVVETEPSPMDGLSVRREERPDRSIVEDEDGNRVATFTDGASTVTIAGPERVFDEPTASAAVTSKTWVRLLPEPFDGEVDGAWLEEARQDDSADVLATAMEYVTGAPDLFDEDGVLLAADASYGPLQPDGTRPVGSDWHDFQGRDASYDGVTDPADPEEFRSLDCSGYVRMVFGVRFGMQMSLRPDGGASLPRRSMEQAADAPGVVPIANEGTKVTDRGSLQPGDLVFFDAPSDDDGVIDHVGIYLGIDDEGLHRFIHSRRSSDGPTMGGDSTGPSVLDGDGFFADGFRSTRRL